MWKHLLAFPATPRFIAILALASIGFVPQAQAAALMGFADSTMVMGEFGPDYQEMMANYSAKVGQAYGVEFMRMRDKNDRTSTISALSYTNLLKRWNFKGGQANFWFTGGIGESHGDDQSGLAYTPSVQFDYETTRVYLLGKLRMVRAPGMNFDSASVQAGFSFYETGFDQTQPWFVLEARTMSNMSPAFQVTPALRFINKNYFVEVGMTNPFTPEDRMPRVNLMFVF
ncbi:hypothetical protein [Methylobacillus flagellatus]|uniref:hypothetical protein n=1 Tax=Methylobacillus flagellatus TaxID=405 RepID=UPI0010F4F914|nr:hypothetical protein [Methylobacillus flagellatus]